MSRGYRRQSDRCLVWDKRIGLVAIRAPEMSREDDMIGIAATRELVGMEARR